MANMQEHGAQRKLARLIYVDDERQSLKYFERILADSGCVVTCLNPNAALELLRSTATDFVGIVADQRMPLVSGDQIPRVVAEQWPRF